MGSTLKAVTVIALLATAISGASAARTCNASLPTGANKGGFDICVFRATGNLLTNTIGPLANTIWAIQAALGLGVCKCNQDCSPSQIVCDSTLQDELYLGEYGNVYNGFVQIAYNADDYQVYCYCPNYVAQNNTCPFTAQPQQCPYVN